MSVWLLSKAESSTAKACIVLGVGIVIGTRLPFVQRRAGSLGIYLAAIVLALVMFQQVFDLREELVGILGRDMTFTGRTEIWQAVLKESTDPLFGAGYYSFWMGDRVDRLSAVYHYALNEAHNGYIEVYLNSGLVGVVMLALLIFGGFMRTRREVTQGSSLGRLRFAFVIGIALYAMTEAVFNRLDLLWFAFLWAITDCPPDAAHPNEVPPEIERRKASQNFSRQTAGDSRR